MLLGRGCPMGLASICCSCLQQSVRDFAYVLRQFADLCLAKLPQETLPDRSIDDMHHVRLKPDVKPVAIAPYR